MISRTCSACSSPKFALRTRDSFRPFPSGLSSWLLNYAALAFYSPPSVSRFSISLVSHSISATAMANPSNFQITPCVALVENNEINFRSLYFRATELGTPTGHINWTVYDGPDEESVVARAQGVHNTFSLVFEVERFKGSTLQVMGLFVVQGEWAIVGGTGKFARATGVISKKLHEKKSKIELTIHAICPLPKGSLSLVPKIGPFGGDKGTKHDIAEAPRRLESITVYSVEKKVVNSIAFSYIDHTGRKHKTGSWGGSGGERHQIELDPSKFVKEVSGTFGTYKGYTVITSLMFVTNDNKTRGPYGDSSAKETRFSVPVQDSSVVGFFGRSGTDFLHAVGVYVHPF